MRISNKDISKRRKYHKENAASKDKRSSSRMGSISFFAALPANLILIAIAVVSIFELFGVGVYNIQSLALFAVGLLGCATVVGSSDHNKIFVLVHELKHAVTVLLTGNRLLGMTVEERTGDVSFQMYVDQARYGPFILLAPYCFPLLSFPTLVALLFFGDFRGYLEPLLLGAALGIDLATGYIELHPAQTDLKRVLGGFVTAGLFIGSTWLLWTLVCMVWLLAGGKGYLFSGVIAVELAERIAWLFKEAYLD